MLRVAESFEDSDTGRQRRANEDSSFARAPLFAVADGMGGAQAGEVASRMAVETLEPGLPDGPGSIEERLAGLVQQANARIHQHSREDDDRAGMGTTFTAAYVGEDDLSIAHVGDSRLYLLRDGSFERLTRDHSLVDELVREGKLTPEEADVHPQRSIITRALGPEPAVEVDSITWRARAGDIYLLCSDGLTSMVPEAKVGEIVGAASSLRVAGHARFDAANLAGGRDNITVVLFRLAEVVFGGATDVTAGDEPTADQPTRLGATAPSVEEVRAAVQDAQRSQPSGPAPADEHPAVESAIHMHPRDGGAVPPPAVTDPGRPSPVSAREPRLRSGTDPDGGGPKQRGPARRIGRGLLWLAIVLFPFAAGGYIATQAVYFVGVDDEGFVSVYKGVPYELPGGLAMYSENFVSGVPARTLPARARTTVTAHKLRSLKDANDLVRQIERGELAGQADG